MKCLQANDVVYAYQNKYQTVRALNGVSADFILGKMYAIIGASGSGKTTFLSLLAGLDVPSAGSITWNGESTTRIDRDNYRLEYVSVIYQNFNLFFHLTVLENAAYPLYVRKMAKREADILAREKLLSVGLKDEQFRRFPNMLSGGVSPSRGRWQRAVKSFWPTSPRAIWTARTAERLSRFYSSRPMQKAGVSSLSPTIPQLRRLRTLFFTCKTAN